MAEFDEKIKAAFDAEFERTRPRPGLRGRVIANAVATPRVRQRSWLTPRSFALVGAAAAVLVVAGIGLRNATQGPPTAVKSPAPSPAVLAFGKLPAPVLHPPIGLGAGGGPQQTAVPYFGPATMTWSGQLPKVPPTAPVYKFAVPTVADADAFATRLGARLVAPGSANEPRTYQAPDGYTLYVHFDDPFAGEPTFSLGRDLGPNPRQPLTEDGARAAADAELSRLLLTPSWRAEVDVSKFTPIGGGQTLFTVRYARFIPIPSGPDAIEVDGNGSPSGIEVQVDSGGRVFQISGALRLAETSATYPLRAPSTVVAAAVSATPSMPKSSGPAPAVALTRVTLVYTSVVSGGVGYLEPAYLFTGTFTADGLLNEKRVLVPALAARAIGP